MRGSNLQYSVARILNATFKRLLRNLLFMQKKIDFFSINHFLCEFLWQLESYIRIHIIMFIFLKIKNSSILQFLEILLNVVFYYASLLRNA